MHSLDPKPYRRFLKYPTGRNATDDHPWFKAFGEGLATCQCCGAGIKRAVITEISAGDKVYGLDCYAKLFPVEGREIKRRLTGDKKCRANWEHFLKNDSLKSPVFYLDRPDHPVWKTSENRTTLRARCSEGGLYTDRVRQHLIGSVSDESDCADLLSILDKAIADTLERIATFG